MRGVSEGAHQWQSMLRVTQIHSVRGSFFVAYIQSLSGCQQSNNAWPCERRKCIPDLALVGEVITI